MLLFIEVFPKAVHRVIRLEHGSRLAEFDAVLDDLIKQGANDYGGYSAELIMRLDRDEEHLEGIVLALQSLKHSDDAEREEPAV